MTLWAESHRRARARQNIPRGLLCLLHKAECRSRPQRLHGAHYREQIKEVVRVSLWRRIHVSLGFLPCLYGMLHAVLCFSFFYCFLCAEVSLCVFVSVYLYALALPSLEDRHIISNQDWRRNRDKVDHGIRVAHRF